MESSDVELDLQRSVQAVLRELSAQAPALQSNQGMWRWSLHKKVERDPAKSPALVRILLRELEKAESEDLRHVIIPLLHTLMYVLTKATGITEELYRRTYTFCTRLLTLPAPYCTVALDCAIRLKTETAVPGTLYQRLVIAEQNLTSELYPYQERVFLFVDPELVSPSVCSALLLEIEAAQVQQTPEACMRHVVSHALQAALGDACHASALQRKLKASPRGALERYFHAVVAAVEQMASDPSPSREGHQERLEEIYCSLLGPAAAARGRYCGDPLQDPQPSIPLPSPHITFHLWTDEEQLWKELVLFLRPRSQVRLSADLEALDLQGLWPDRDLARASMLSTDSGIERDLPSGADEPPGPGSPETERAGLQRKGGIRKRVWPPDVAMPACWAGPQGLHRRTGVPGGVGELVPGVSRLHTARVLVLGDDRMLGRLAQAYHSLRKRETQKFCLTPRLSLQLYYIPVLAPEKPASCRHSELRELATFLGRADPWYESTVNTLCPAIHKLAEMPPSLDTSRTVDPFILDVITYYVRMGTQPIYFQIYTVKIFRDLSQDPAEDIFLTELNVKIQDSKLPKVSGPTHTPPSAAPITDHTCLNVSVTEVVKSSNLAGRSFSTVTNTFRTATIQIQSQDQRLLTLLLDKDGRRMFRDVVRFEVAPCPEPCSGVRKTKAPWLGSHQLEVEGTKAKPKPLLMPINTFSGIVQ
ncbi:phosphoinositide 3-kinase regulatory subunit 6 isoform X4 [Vulpes lagopus]|uniref:phosphoinositide 3-kinase regulatory subunit 6 isoform X4 n=1 Tax=Vulpes lagopus TaxID=494514 RepID=UPI001BC9A8C3|nr:phosphoinositide 3-kinase regulatory subunit 6 isoform X4 [Vulpes lagopus]